MMQSNRGGMFKINQVSQVGYFCAYVCYSHTFSLVEYLPGGSRDANRQELGERAADEIL